ncbi:hypothetical protein J2S09_004041 [Bacillus fengqiuensis]|nr:hypothetical protein [Bacillus fengqiuensis]
MNIKVYLSGQESGIISYPSLAAFRLFCEQCGFSTAWDMHEQKIFVEPSLKEKTVVLKLAYEQIHEEMAKELGEKFSVSLQQFLSNTGANVVIHDGDSLSNNGDFFIFLTFSSDIHPPSTPTLTFFNNFKHKYKSLKHHLHEELKHLNVDHIFEDPTKESKKNKSSFGPFLDTKCTLPEFDDQSNLHKFGENLALLFASSILYYFSQGYRSSTFSFLGPDILKVFLNHNMKLPSAEQTEQIPSSLVPADIKSPSYTNENTAAPPTPVQMVSPPEKTLQAEVFFDYTVIHSNKADQFIITGNFNIKNTGNDNLYNPIVCLRANLPANVQLSGQILPPNMVEGMGLRNDDGVKGWRFMDDNWYEKAQEHGEYWICPIQPLQISLAETQSVQNFQLRVNKPEKEKKVVVEGFVYFQSHDLNFASNNRIAFSF